MDEQKRSIFENRATINYLYVPVIALCFGLRFGLNYGISNHNTYLLHGLRLYRPELLANDWLVGQATDYHPVFSYLAGFFYNLSQTGWAFGLANVISIMLGGLIIYRILTTLVRSEYVLPVFLLLIGIMSATGTFSVSGSYIFSGIFQPSTISGLGYLAAFYFFLRERYIISGIFLGLGGVFHANYLVLGFPLFFLAHLLIGRENLFSRLIRQLGIPILALVPLLTLMITVSGSHDLGAARTILFNIRSPHHYLPFYFYKEFIPFGGWLLLLYVIGWKAFAEKDEAKHFRALFIASFSLVILATLLTTLVFIPAVAQLYFWRLAPFLVLLGQIAIATGVMELLNPNGRSIPLNMRSFILIFFSLLCISAKHIVYSSYLFPAVLFVIFMLLVLSQRASFSRQFSPGRSRNTALVISICAWILLGSVPLKDLRARSSLLSGLPIQEKELYEWVQKTPVESIFLIPPGLERFRLHGKRAIVVDWKSTPILPGELVEWYNRIKVVSGIDDVSSLEEAEKGYSDVNLELAGRIRSLYDFNYIVVRNGSDNDIKNGYEEIFRNESYTVFGEGALE